MAVSVVIVDDHELVGQGISKFIEQNEAYKVSAVLTDPSEAVSKIPILNPDVLITDLDMPGINGLELIQRLRQEGVRCKVVLLTMHLSQLIIKKVTEHDLDGYLPKNADEFEFFQCLDTITKGRKYYSQKAMEVLSSASKPIETTGLKKTQYLTPREREILCLITEGLSTREIAENLIIAVRTVETHRKSIMEKLEVNNVAGMVRIAVQEGLLEG